MHQATQGESWDGGHMNEQLLERYCVGACSPPEEQTIEEHLLLCELCRESVGETMEFIAEIQMAMLIHDRKIRFQVQGFQRNTYN